MPTPEQRQVLQRRALQVEAWLAPIDPERLRVELQATLGMLKGDKMSPEEASFEVAMHSSVLADIPAFAVVAACRDYLTGKRNGGWRPKPPEMRLAAQDHVAAMRRERNQIAAVLAAEPEPVLASSEKRKAARRIVNDLLLEIEAAGQEAECKRRGVPWVPQNRPKHPDEIIDDLNARKDDPPPPLSPETRAIIGLQSKSEREVIE